MQVQTTSRLPYCSHPQMTIAPRHDNNEVVDQIPSSLNETQDFEANKTVLNREGIIDEEGGLIKKSPVLPPLDKKELLVVAELLTTPLDIELDGIFVKKSLVEILSPYLEELSEVPVKEIKLGGLAAKALLKNHFFLYLCQSGLNAKEAADVIEKVPLSVSPLSINITTTSTLPEKLLSFKRSLISFFVRVTSWSPFSRSLYDKYNTFISKRQELFLHSKCHALKISLPIQDKEGHETQLHLNYALSGMERASFCHDSFQIPLIPFLLKYIKLGKDVQAFKEAIHKDALKDEVFPESDYGEQAYVDNLTGILRIATPERIDCQAWANLLAALLKGYYRTPSETLMSPLEHSALKRVYDTLDDYHKNKAVLSAILTEKLNNFIPNRRRDNFEGLHIVIAFEIERILKEEFQNDPLAALFVTLRACVSLADFDKREVVKDYIEKIWNMIRPHFDQSFSEKSIPSLIIRLMECNPANCDLALTFLQCKALLYLLASPKTISKEFHAALIDHHSHPMIRILVHGMHFVLPFNVNIFTELLEQYKEITPSTQYLLALLNKGVSLPCYQGSDTLKLPLKLNVGEISALSTQASSLLLHSVPCLKQIGLELLLRSYSLHPSLEALDLFFSHFPRVFATINTEEDKLNLLEGTKKAFRAETIDSLIAEWEKRLSQIKDPSPIDYQIAWILALATSNEASALKALEGWEKIASELGNPKKENTLKKLVSCLKFTRPDLALALLLELPSEDRERLLREIGSLIRKKSEFSKRFQIDFDNYQLKNMEMLLKEDNFKTVVALLEDPSWHIEEEGREKIIISLLKMLTKKTVWPEFLKSDRQVRQKCLDYLTTMIAKVKGQSHPAALPCSLFISNYLKDNQLERKSPLIEKISNSTSWLLGSLSNAQKAGEIKTLITALVRSAIPLPLDSEALAHCFWAIQTLSDTSEKLRDVQEVHQFFEIVCQLSEAPTSRAVKKEQGSLVSTKKGEKKKHSSKKRVHATVNARTPSKADASIPSSPFTLITHLWIKVMRAYIRHKQSHVPVKWLFEQFSQGKLPLKHQPEDLSMLLFDLLQCLRTESKFKLCLKFLNKFDTNSLNSEMKKLFARWVFDLVKDPHFTPEKCLKILKKYEEILPFGVSEKEKNFLKLDLIKKVLEKEEVDEKMLLDINAFLKKCHCYEPSLWKKVFEAGSSRKSTTLVKALYHTFTTYLEKNADFQESPDRPYCWLYILKEMRGSGSFLGYDLLRDLTPLQEAFKSNPSLLESALKIALEGAFHNNFTKRTENKEEVDYINLVYSNIFTFCKNSSFFPNEQKKTEFVIYCDILFLGLKSLNGNMGTIKQACKILADIIQQLNTSQLETYSHIYQLNQAIMRIGEGLLPFSGISKDFALSIKTLILRMLELPPHDVNDIYLLNILAGLPEEMLEEEHLWENIFCMIVNEYKQCPINSEKEKCLTIILNRLLEKAARIKKVSSLCFILQCLESFLATRGVFDSIIYWPLFLTHMHGAIKLTRQADKTINEQEKETLEKSDPPNSLGSVPTESYSTLFNKIPSALKVVFSDLQARKKIIQAANNLLIEFFNDDNELFMTHFEKLIEIYSPLILWELKKANSKNAEKDAPFLTASFKMELIQNILHTCRGREKLPKTCFSFILEALYALISEEKDKAFYQSLIDLIIFDVDAINIEPDLMKNLRQLVLFALGSELFEDKERSFQYICFCNFIPMGSLQFLSDEKRSIYFTNFIQRLLKRGSPENFAIVLRSLLNLPRFFLDRDFAARVFRSTFDTIVNSIETNKKGLILLKILSENLLNPMVGTSMLSKNGKEWSNSQTYAVWRLCKALENKNFDFPEKRFTFAHHCIAEASLHYYFNEPLKKNLCIEILIKIALQFWEESHQKMAPPSLLRFQEMISQITDLIIQIPEASVEDPLFDQRRATFINSFLQQLVKNGAKDAAKQVFDKVLMENIYQSTPHLLKEAQRILNLSED